MWPGYRAKGLTLLGNREVYHLLGAKELIVLSDLECVVLKCQERLIKVESQGLSLIWSQGVNNHFLFDVPSSCI